MVRHEDLLELLRKRHYLHERTVKTYNEKLVDGKLSADDQVIVRNMQTERDSFDGQIELLRNQLAAEDKYTEGEEGLRNLGLKPTVGDFEERSKKANEEYRQAFARYLIRGESKMEPEFRKVLESGPKIEFTAEEKRDIFTELRALSVGTDALGGYTVPTEMLAQIELAKLKYGGIFKSRAFVLETMNGREIELPTGNDTDNTGQLLAEAAADAVDEDPAFGQKVLNAYMFSSKIVKISIELIQDSIIQMEKIIGDMLGERIGRAQSNYFTTGTGSSQPNGIVTASILGKTGAGGQTTTITAADLIDLKHSVDVAYRESAEYMMHDSTLKAIKLLVDDNSRPLWSSGLAAREPATIDGDPYVINNSMAVMAASAKSMLYGDMSKFWIRNVKGIELFRFSELYMVNRQIGLVAFQRADSEALNAGTNPIKHYINAAS